MKVSMMEPAPSKMLESDGDIKCEHHPFMERWGLWGVAGEVDEFVEVAVVIELHDHEPFDPVVRMVFVGNSVELDNVIVVPAHPHHLHLFVRVCCLGALSILCDTKKR